MGDDDALNDDQQVPPKAEQEMGQEGDGAVAELAPAAFDPHLIAVGGVQRVARVRAMSNQTAQRLTDGAIPLRDPQLVKVFAIAFQAEPKIDHNLHAHALRFAPARLESPAAKQSNSSRALRFI